VSHNVTTLETTLEWPVETFEGRSARARTRIPVGTPVCRMDPLLAMTTLLYDSNPRLRSLEFRIDTEQGTQVARLALVILVEVEKGAASFWAPYLGILPADPMPTYRAAELAEFQDQVLLDYIERANSEEAREWKVIRSAMDVAPNGFNTSVFNFGRFQWARRITRTRSFALWGRRHEYMYALVPVCDLLNHNGSGHWRMASPYYPRPVPDPWLSDRVTQIDCTHDVAAGDQVFTNYYHNGLPTMLFVATYGFVPERNDHDELLLPGGRRVSANLDFTALRQWCAESIPAPGNVEAACLDFFQSELNKMPTTLKADLELLAQQQRGVQASTPLLYRISRKRIFVKHIQTLMDAGNRTGGVPLA